MKEERNWDVIYVAAVVVGVVATAWMVGTTVGCVYGHLAEVTFWRTGCVFTVIAAFCGRIIRWW